MDHGLNSAVGSFLKCNGLQRNALLFTVAPLMVPGTLTLPITQHLEMFVTLFKNWVFLHLSERSFNGLRLKCVSWKLSKHTLPYQTSYSSRAYFCKNTQHVSKAFISVHTVL